MMDKPEMLDYLYIQCESGMFDIAYLDIREGYKTGLNAKKVAEACKRNDVDFDEFLKYAKKRKRCANGKG